MSEFTYRPQQVDYLGFLEAQLRDLQGIDRLAYELIQNADDVQAEDGTAQGVPPPTRLIFDVTDDALVVENDGVFRPRDFRRLQRIAGGAKRDEPDTTGAFGLGFIAVYQVTDAPEIFSNDLHWIIRPDAQPDRRIRERQTPTDGTRFVLPWAFDGASTVRRALRLPAVDPQRLDAIAADLAAAIGLAALFLKRLTRLEVHRSGDSVRRLHRDVTEQGLLLTEADGQSIPYLLFKGNFSVDADRLRREYPWQIEEKRHAGVTLAVPVAALPDQGRLFAVLPTDSTMPLPVYVNADFFPTTDRRRIHFDEGYQARWNEQALACAARVLGEALHGLRQALQPDDLWLLLQRALDTEQAAVRQELPAPFTAFWQALAPQLSQLPLVYTSDGAWLPAAQARIVADQGAHDLLQSLRIPVVHPRLQPFYPLLRRPEIGVPRLSLDDMRQALRRLNLTHDMPLDQAPPFLRALDAWRRLWRLLDDLLDPLPRHEQRETVMRRLGDLPLVLDDGMSLVPLRRVYRGDAEARALFPDLSWLHEMLDEETFPGRFVPQFGARQAVDYLADLSQEQLEESWRMGRLDLPRLFRWFEARQIEIFADDPALQRELRNLPLVPIGGELRPLAHLYIPGGFEDPLKLAAVVDVEALGGRRQFLQDLGLQQLDFDTYVHTHIPRVLAQNPDLPSDARHRLVQLLAERLGHIRDDHDLRQQLSRLPLVACMDGSFRPAREAYATREAAELLGPRARVAEPPPNDAVHALHRWLGLRRQPAAADLVQRLLDLAAAQAASRQPLDDETLSIVLQCWQRLERLFQEDDLSAADLQQLRAHRTLPNRARVMSQPDRLLFLDRPDLAASFDAASQLDKYLLLEDELRPLLETTGVRRLSDAVDLHVPGARAATPHATIGQRLRQRRALVARLLGAAESHDLAHLRVLDDLRVLQLPDLQTRYRLQLGATTFESDPQAQAAVLVAAHNVLYVDAAADPPPWPAIARELANAIKSGQASGAPAGALALGIREVLAAPTPQAAAAVLDELGYP